jgi:hypothetical protein
MILPRAARLTGETADNTENISRRLSPMWATAFRPSHARPGLKTQPYSRKKDSAISACSAVEYTLDVHFPAEVLATADSFTGCDITPLPAESHAAKRTHLRPAALNGISK